MKIILLAFLIFGIPLLSSASDLMCASKGRGFLPYNTKTGVFIGSGYLYNKGECNEALGTTERPDIGEGLVCSWTGKGWNIYNSATGSPLNESAYWSALSTCQAATSNAYIDVVCAPRGTGSGVFNVKDGFFIGSGYYFDINDCVFAAVSRTDNKICAPNQGYTSVFYRSYNRLVSNELFMTARQCFRELTNGEL